MATILVLPYSAHQRHFKSTWNLTHFPRRLSVSFSLISEPPVPISHQESRAKVNSSMVLEKQQFRPQSRSRKSREILDRKFVVTMFSISPKSRAGAFFKTSGQFNNATIRFSFYQESTFFCFWFASWEEIPGERSVFSREGVRGGIMKISPRSGPVSIQSRASTVRLPHANHASLFE